MGEDNDEESASVVKFPDAPGKAAGQEGDDVTIIVEAFEKLAAMLEGEARKQPKSGAGFLTSSQDRYFAVQSSANDLRGKPERRLHNWRHGRLAWWKDQRSFKKNDDPKGSLDLMNIRKVLWDEEHPKRVIVRHVEEQDDYDLVLTFSAEDVAKMWRFALTQIRNL